MSSGSGLYDEIKQICPIDNETEEKIFSSTIQLNLEHLEQIYVIIICYFYEDCLSNGFTNEQILFFLQQNIPYGGEVMNKDNGNGIKYNINNIPERLKSLLSYYLNNYFEIKK